MALLIKVKRRIAQLRRVLTPGHINEALERPHKWAAVAKAA
jgi:hypothetical protein